MFEVGSLTITGRGCEMIDSAPGYGNAKLPPLNQRDLNGRKSPSAG